MTSYGDWAVTVGLLSEKSAVSLPDSPDTSATASRHPFASGVSHEQQLPSSDQTSASGQNLRPFFAAAPTACLLHDTSQHESRPDNQLLQAEHEKASQPHAASDSWTPGGNAGLTALPGSMTRAEQQAEVNESEGVSQQGQLVTAPSPGSLTYRGPFEALTQSQTHLGTEHNPVDASRSAVKRVSKQQNSGEAGTALNVPQRLKGGSEAHNIEHGSQDSADTHKGPLQGHFQTASEAKPPPTHTQGSDAPVHPHSANCSSAISDSAHTQQSTSHHAHEPSELDRSARVSFGLDSCASPSSQGAQHALSPFESCQHSAAGVREPDKGQTSSLDAARKLHRSHELIRPNHRLQIATGIGPVPISACCWCNSSSYKTGTQPLQLEHKRAR